VDIKLISALHTANTVETENKKTKGSKMKLEIID
jgi:hypothetical protein